MKLGQMISMDAGDVLPAELTAILARLRDAAHFMPPAQLRPNMPNLKRFDPKNAPMRFLPFFERDARRPRPGVNP
jgi:hypothetical protein